MKRIIGWVVAVLLVGLIFVWLQQSIDAEQQRKQRQMDDAVKKMQRTRGAVDVHQRDRGV